MTADDSTHGAARRFSSAAGTYDRHADVQRAAADALVAVLPPCDPRTILDVGCGTGYLTGLVANRYPAASVTAIDVAAGMLAEAARAHGPSTRVRFETANFLEFAPGTSFDLIVSNCVLHWMQPVKRPIAHAAALLAPGGVLAFALMLAGTLEELHAARLQAAPANPPRASMPPFEEVSAACRAAGLKVLHAESTWDVRIAPDAKAVFRLLREQGLTSGTLGRGATPLRRAELAALEKIYNATYKLEDGVSVTYCVGTWVVQR